MSDFPAWIDRSARTRLLVTGRDRLKTLHNLTTQDVLTLKPGEGREAFVTSPRGKTLAWISIHALPDALLLRGDERAAEVLLPHFQKYALFDEVTWIDRQDATFETHVIGPWPSPIELPNLGVATLTWAGKTLVIVRESPTAIDGTTLIGETADAGAIAEAVRGQGVTKIDAESFEALRIEAGTPRSGEDVTAEDLPQEFERDARAISFKKGCYLGQETVARLDALGHVNRVFRGLVCEPGADLKPGSTLLGEDAKPAGKVTSATFSKRLGRFVALGLVRTRQAEPGTTLKTESGHRVMVASLPINA